MLPLFSVEGSDEQLDAIADDVANVLGAFSQRTDALRLLLKKVRDRISRNDSEARKFLASHSGTPRG
jgi:hypothetical protein